MEKLWLSDYGKNMNVYSIHPLDLPNVRQRPSSEELWNIINGLKVEVKNFEPPPALPRHLASWLTHMLSSTLDWLPEDEAADIHDAIATRLSQTCVTSRSYTIREIVVDENTTFNLHEPGLTADNLGLKTWGSSLVLSKRLKRQPELIRGMHLIELGAGTGLCGFTAASMGAKVHLTDLPEIVPNIEKNIEANKALFTEAVPTASVLDWTKPLSEDLPEFDAVLVSDPVYSEHAPMFLSKTVNDLGCPKLLLQLPLRPKFESLRSSLYDMLQLQGFKRLCYEIEQGSDDFGPSDFAFSIWER